MTTTSTLIKLFLFSCLVFIVPLGLFSLTYYGYLDVVWGATIGVPTKEHKAYYGGILAVVGVNAVVIAYIVSAFNEEIEPVKED